MYVSKEEGGREGKKGMQSIPLHTYRAHFACFSWSKSCWCCSCDFAHRLQSFASNWHFLFVVVIVALLLAHKQLVRVTRKVRGTLRDLLRFHGRLCCSSCRRRVSFDFCLSSCRGFFSLLQHRADEAWKGRKRVSIIGCNFCIITWHKVRLMLCVAMYI